MYSILFNSYIGTEEHYIRMCCKPYIDTLQNIKAFENLRLILKQSFNNINIQVCFLDTRLRGLS